jgi:hypothetical protein
MKGWEIHSAPNFNEPSSSIDIGNPASSERGFDDMGSFAIDFTSQSAGS